MSLVSIPNCAAQHLLGEEQIHLITGAELQLIQVKGSSTTPPLTLTLGESLAFPLNEHVIIGTQAGNGNVYLLRPHLELVEGPQGWIRIELPEGVEDASSELGKLRDTWEEVLVKHGFLFGDKVQAGGDEIENGIKEGAEGAKNSLAGAAQSYKSSHDPTDAPTSFSRNTHNRARQASDLTSTAASYAQQASNFIGGLSHAVGTSIAHTLGVGQVPEESKTETRKTAEATGRTAADISSGITNSITGTIAHAGREVKGVIAHDKGDEAADLSGNVGSTAGNVGKVAGAGLMTTSMAFHGTEAARGVVEEDLNPGVAKVEMKEVEETAEDLQQSK